MTTPVDVLERQQQLEGERLFALAVRIGLRGPKPATVQMAIERAIDLGRTRGEVLAAWAEIEETIR
jgi:hypothetical protein